MPREKSLTATTDVSSADATLSSGTDERVVHVLDSRNDELLTVHDAARFLNASVSWVYEHTRDTRNDRLPVFKLGKYLRFHRSDPRAYIDAKRAEFGRQPRRR